MSDIDFINDDVKDIFRRCQFEEGERRIDQVDKRREAEVELLSDTTPREYIRRRHDQSRLVVEPDLPLDEMTPADYIKARTRQQTRPQETPPPVGTSYREYLTQKEKKENV